MAVRDESVAAIADRYRAGLRWEKVRILDEFVAVLGMALAALGRAMGAI